MATVLYITAHPHDDQVSYSMAVGKEFIEAYREANPQDEVIRLDLYKIDVPQIDVDVFSGWGKLRSGVSLDQLSAEEKRKVSRLNEIVEQYIAADKYVFVSPMWNFSFPPVLKAYIDAICIAGKTFKYTENGPVGLLGNKKALHIQARGGVYSEGPAASFESGHSYLAKIMQFHGVPSFEGIFVEGMAAMPDQAQTIKEKAIDKARQAAKNF
ncbi:MULTISPECIES: FMN-dependent NADH-azoreductase [unclassified Paenibacillus]|uniref:FMN-dependent NADH-azoreductase n=1 Tax=unclassified Paenibacillus TaxID=185978 RepID=UPI001AE2AE33|nr:MULTISPECIES: FMN-dependent NADH-azoreductase [unclassified Paenibacillus]MBP1157065.1 FMN-dependent NADH-azoreductase [Paenibacillus sp. PvP091]MBP1172196.1 FMN-dependent NADH-azoreductase [Paenibacillus sp. PvR098]MBP2438577.1 FMN-dependent NADH-azoreductase [Paenibacillus sp. PvP052]